jgi:HSP90 family molecular chaperone
LPEDAEEKEEKKEDYDEQFKPLIDFLQQELSARIGRVKISDRLVHSPCAIVAESWGYTATMERIVKAQALADPNTSRSWIGKKVLEINPKHPIIQELNKLVQVVAHLCVFVCPHG